jgi:SAM-dependent methyltransferase
MADPASPSPLQRARPVDNEDVCRRAAVLSTLTRSSQILDVGPNAGFAALFLARELGCTAVVADDDQARLRRVAEQASALALGDKVFTRKVDFTHLSFQEREFNIIFALLAQPLAPSASSLRPFLAAKGRLVLGAPMKVGRYPSKTILDFWEKRLATPVLAPKEALQALAATGYEPESAQTLSDLELDELYRTVERDLDTIDQPDAWREEMALFRAHSAKAAVSHGWVVGARKEPGEPAPTRQRG